MVLSVFIGILSLMAPNKTHVDESSWMPAPLQRRLSNNWPRSSSRNHTLGQSWYVPCGVVIGIVLIVVLYKNRPSFFGKKKVIKKNPQEQSQFLQEQFVLVDFFTSCKIKDTNNQCLVHKALSLKKVDIAIKIGLDKKIRNHSDDYLGFRIKKNGKEIFPTQAVKEELKRVEHAEKEHTTVNTGLIREEWERVLNKYEKKKVKAFSFSSLNASKIEYIQYLDKKLSKSHYGVYTNHKGYIENLYKSFFIAFDSKNKPEVHMLSINTYKEFLNYKNEN